MNSIYLMVSFSCILFSTVFPFFWDEVLSFFKIFAVNWDCTHFLSHVFIFWWFWSFTTTFYLHIFFILYHFSKNATEGLWTFFVQFSFKKVQQWHRRPVLFLYLHDTILWKFTDSFAIRLYISLKVSISKAT